MNGKIKYLPEADIQRIHITLVVALRCCCSKNTRLSDSSNGWDVRLRFSLNGFFIITIFHTKGIHANFTSRALMIKSFTLPKINYKVREKKRRRKRYAVSVYLII